MRQGKNGQIRGTLKRRLMTNFLLTALIPVLIFAIISQINIQQRLKENLSDRIKSNLDTAEKNLEMVLISTRQSYMISARMKMFWKL